jgi:hypothetical protein
LPNKVARLPTRLATLPLRVRKKVAMWRPCFGADHDNGL